MIQKIKTIGLSAVILMMVILAAGCSSSSQIQNETTSINAGSFAGINLDTVKAGRFDTGRMWTFDYPPIKYFESAYNFKPSKKWLDNARMSALRFANYCSASFVSADGLVMTNHHCGRESVAKVTKPGEDLFDNGFYAKTLSDERKVPGLYVDQLLLIKDVTNEIQAAINKGKTPEEKVANRIKEMQKIKVSEEKKTGLRIQIVTLYNGAKYSEYGYKRYNDVRLVFSPEAQVGYFGGNDDNFTYPRYDLDVSFFRVYGKDGKPLKTKHYFKWSPNGATAGEPVFIIGNPGRTDRLKTVSELKYMRDIQYPRILKLLNGLANMYSTIIKEHPEKTAELRNRLFGISNSIKAYTGMLKGLRNPVLMQKKIDFERKFQNAVHSNPNLNKKYRNVWQNISRNVSQIRRISNQAFALQINPFFSPKYFMIAQNVVELAHQLKLPEDQRKDMYKGAELDSTINEIFPANFDFEKNNILLRLEVKRLMDYLGKNDVLVKKMIGDRTFDEAVKYIINNSAVTNADRLKALIKKGPDAILNSDDPVLYFVIHSKERSDKLNKQLKLLVAQRQTYSRSLGRALFDIYGTSIPPDATFTLRIADGVVKGYPYNGTIAPTNTTFYGLYNRYYSFHKKYPYNLPKRWQNPPADFNLGTPLDFVSTNDIIGGNSGSPVINEKAQIVGLVFDGNIESLPGDFIFDPTVNRSVSVSSAGLMEAIKYMYKAKRLSDELKNGKMDSPDSTTVNK